MSSNSLTEYSELIAAGRAVYAAQFRGINRNSGKSLPTLQPWYYKVQDKPSKPCMQSDKIEAAMRQASHPDRDYVFIQAADSGSTSPETPYQNYVHKDGKVILCMNNYASRDDLAKAGSPNRMFWSDLMAQCFFRVVRYHHGDLRSLQAIWRITIANYITSEVIKTIQGGRPRTVNLAAGEDGFFALLGTVHGKGPARMLGDYPDMFGRKYISRAHIVDLGGLPAFYWILDEVPPPSPPPSLPPPDRPLSRKERRHLKKLSRSSAPE